MINDQTQLTAVDPAYIHLLRIKLIMPFVMLGSAMVFGYWIPEWYDALWLAGGLAVWLFGLLIFVFVWAPRRYKVTGYQQESDYLRFVVGALWHKEVVVTFNRLQHLELEQGPVERFFGLSRLVLYTAGGSGADLSVPGLKTETAELLKNAILKIVRDEQLSDDAITRVHEDAPDTEAQHGN
ncbi:MAG: PH domain-containing protein [Idiomarina sp.]|nr:PH domain-containing protein [Idiomarina sp.]